MSENFSDELKELDDRIEEVVRWQELAEEYSDVADDSGTFVFLDKLNTLELACIAQKRRTTRLIRLTVLALLGLSLKDWTSYDIFTPEARYVIAAIGGALAFLATIRILYLDK